MKNSLMMLSRYRSLFVRTLIDEVRQKYAGSVAGLFWLVLSPLVLLTLYSIIYLVIFRVQPTSMNRHEYVLHILSGLVPFLGFSDALNAGSSSLSQNRSVLLNTVYPSELVPLRAVFASHIITLVGLAFVVVAAMFLGKSSWVLLLLPFILIFQVLLVAGITWVLSLASLVLRDISHVLGFVTMILLVMSPIAYTPGMVPDGFKYLIYLNPLSYFILAFQDVVALGILPSLWVLAAIAALGLVSSSVGYWIFHRIKKMFFDYV
jgi:lipopolysaccharide transport system permease protein